MIDTEAQQGTVHPPHPQAYVAKSVESDSIDKTATASIDASNATTFVVEPSITSSAVPGSQLKQESTPQSLSILASKSLRSQSYLAPTPVTTGSIDSAPELKTGPSNTNFPVSHQDTTPTPNNILREAYLTLLYWPEEEIFPEHGVL
ncbi:unnamed protein product [Protopolystoma xenopodis]|uniref:Uncharacterized protein n=1 Tax=Protopolystoma xenopodis TaxID=117903 RepID=A0A3S5FGV1_9PLAT|nr:unnamed protein product [Protopolystoma xenopodis]